MSGDGNRDDRPTVIKKVAFASDDHEMSVILATIQRRCMESSRRRGAVRRGLAQQLLRQLLVAGYIQLYGAFPRPMAEDDDVPPSTPKARPPESQADESPKRDAHKDAQAAHIKTAVADASGVQHDNSGQHKQTKVERPGLDFSVLTGGGVNVGTQTS